MSWDGCLSYSTYRLYSTNPLYWRGSVTPSQTRGQELPGGRRLHVVYWKEDMFAIAIDDVFGADLELMDVLLNTFVAGNQKIC